MDLSKYGFEELLLAAIKSEVEAKDVYLKLADRVKNAFLKGRLRLLAKEEEGHREALERMYHLKFDDKEIVLPEHTEVPLPHIEIGDENEPISLVLESAMAAERASEEFYRELSNRVDDLEIKNMLVLLGEMENTHYHILNKEYENLKRFEEYDMVWPMMHVGP